MGETSSIEVRMQRRKSGKQSEHLITYMMHPQNTSVPTFTHCKVVKTNVAAIKAIDNPQ